MPKFEISGTIPAKPVETIYDTAEVIEAIKQFREQNPVASLDYINGHFVIGLDESTLAPIFEGDDYATDEDGCCYELIKSNVDPSVPAEGYDHEDDDL